MDEKLDAQITDLIVGLKTLGYNVEREDSNNKTILSSLGLIVQLFYSKDDEYIHIHYKIADRSLATNEERLRFGSFMNTLLEDLL